MSDKTRVFLFGHSFPARLLRQSRDQGRSVSELMSLNDHITIFVEGHPGLTFARIFDSLPHYLSKMKARPMDILLLNLGTNDLCHVENVPELVVAQALKFLDGLKANDVIPKCIVFLSVLGDQSFPGRAR